jgi:hypothetical protein
MCNFRRADVATVRYEGRGVRGRRIDWVTGRQCQSSQTRTHREDLRHIQPVPYPERPNSTTSLIYPRNSQPEVRHGRPRHAKRVSETFAPAWMLLVRRLGRRDEVDFETVKGGCDGAGDWAGQRGFTYRITDEPQAASPGRVSLDWLYWDRMG